MCAFGITQNFHHDTSAGAVQIDGAAELERKLSTLPQKVARKVISQALRKAANIVLAAAQANAPVRSGKLRRSLKVRVGTRNRPGTYAMIVTSGSASSSFATETYYGAFVHFGYRVGHRRLGDKRRLVKARPFIDEAYTQSQYAAREAALRAMKLGIEGIARAKGAA